VAFIPITPVAAGDDDPVSKDKSVPMTAGIVQLTPPDPASMLLVARDVVMAFGGVRALDGMSFWVPHAGAVGLLGQNGSGKTTLLNVITGQLMPQSGTVHFAGKEMAGSRLDAYAKAGIARVFQSVQVFPRLTVLENLMVAQLGSDEANASVEFARSVLKRMRLEHLENELTRDISYGHQRLLEIAMALAARAKLILFDEPTAGLGVDLAEHVVLCMQELHKAGTAIVVIEHETSVVFRTCDVVWVLNEGRVIARGTPDEIRGDRQVLDLYLGTSKT
jgi:ABC-type branched-subunit amino acid transport system ATPase component